MLSTISSSPSKVILLISCFLKWRITWAFLLYSRKRKSKIVSRFGQSLLNLSRGMSSINYCVWFYVCSGCNNRADKKEDRIWNIRIARVEAKANTTKRKRNNIWDLFVSFNWWLCLCVLLPFRELCLADRHNLFYNSAFLRIRNKDGRAGLSVLCLPQTDSILQSLHRDALPPNGYNRDVH